MPVCWRYLNCMRRLAAVGPVNCKDVRPMRTHALLVGAIVVAAIALAMGSVAGCRRNLGRAIEEIQELEPKAKKRNAEVRKLTGVPDDEDK